MQLVSVRVPLDDVQLGDLERLDDGRPELRAELHVVRVLGRGDVRLRDDVRVRGPLAGQPHVRRSDARADGAPGADARADA